MQNLKLLLPQKWSDVCGGVWLSVRHDRKSTRRERKHLSEMQVQVKLAVQPLKDMERTLEADLAAERTEHDKLARSHRQMQKLLDNARSVAKSTQQLLETTPGNFAALAKTTNLRRKQLVTCKRR